MNLALRDLPNRNRMTGRVAILVAALDPAGAERVAINLSEALAQAGLEIDLVLVRRRGDLLNEVANGVRVVDLCSTRALTAIFPFRKYLQRAEPAAIIAVNFEVNVTASIALIGLKNKPLLVLSVHCAPSAVLAAGSRARKWLTIPVSRLLYPRADWVVAVSEGAAAELTTMGWSKATQTVTIYNPVVRQDFENLASAPAEHPWTADPAVPLIVAVGRLAAQKDFPLLLRAFARVNARRAARLMILGEGEDRALLEQQIAELGLSNCAILMGHLRNPYPYLKAANLFVLSSAYEGFGNVIVEALAAGAPVVSTDCPHGPREILADGKWGKLVPVGDEVALAEAIRETLEDPPSEAQRERGRQRACDFTVEAAAHKYLELIQPHARAERDG